MRSDNLCRTARLKPRTQPPMMEPILDLEAVKAEFEPSMLHSCRIPLEVKLRLNPLSNYHSWKLNLIRRATFIHPVFGRYIKVDGLTEDKQLHTLFNHPVVSAWVISSLDPQTSAEILSNNLALILQMLASKHNLIDVDDQIWFHQAYATAIANLDWRRVLDLEPTIHHLASSNSKVTTMLRDISLTWSRQQIDALISMIPEYANSYQVAGAMLLIQTTCPQ